MGFTFAVLGLGAGDSASVSFGDFAEWEAWLSQKPYLPLCHSPALEWNSETITAT